MGHKYSKKQVIHICKSYLAVADEFEWQTENVEALIQDSIPVIDQFGGWGWIYTKPYNEFLRRLLGLTGKDSDSVVPAPEALTSQDWSIEDLQAHYDNPPELDALQQIMYVHMVQALRGHVLAMDIFSQSMDVLIGEAAKGDDDALFKAIFIDPVVLTSPPVQIRLAKATLLKDNEFFDRLTRALKQTKPRRPAEKYDSIRYLIGILDGGQVLDGFNNTEVCDIFINHLNIYPHDSEDPYSGLTKLIKSIRAQSRK